MEGSTLAFLSILFGLFYLFSLSAPLEKYKHIAQEPKTGVHTLRVGKFAFVDTFATLVAAVLLGWKLREDPVIIFLILVVFSVPIHFMFGVNTALVKLINYEV
jgi:hypothetical protein